MKPTPKSHRPAPPAPPAPIYWADEPITPDTVRKLQAELLKQRLNNQVRSLKERFYEEIARNPASSQVWVSLTGSMPWKPDVEVVIFSEEAVNQFLFDLGNTGFHCSKCDTRSIHIAWNLEKASK